MPLGLFSKVLDAFNLQNDNLTFKAMGKVSKLFQFKFSTTNERNFSVYMLRMHEFLIKFQKFLLNFQL